MNDAIHHNQLTLKTSKMPIGTRVIKKKVKNEVKDVVGLDNDKKGKLGKDKKKDKKGARKKAGEFYNCNLTLERLAHSLSFQLWNRD
jgi:hypothetical protein